MSGLGRDWPSGSAHNWPYDADGGGAPPANGLPFPTRERFFGAIEEHYMVSPPWAYPQYSNTGFGLLGLALVEAASAAYGTQLSHAELLKRDIFDPLGLNSTHFLVTGANKDRIVVPSFDSDIVVRRMSSLYAYRCAHAIIAGCGLHGHDESRRGTVLVSF